MVSFALACAQNEVDQRHTKPRHPWTNGQVARMNRTLEEATVKRHNYNTHDQLRRHLDDFVAAYTFARWLKTFYRPHTLRKIYSGPGPGSPTASPQIRPTNCRDQTTKAHPKPKPRSLG